MRLAFDHFDEDASGELDRAEFRRAMMDCGMMPLGFEVESLFREADEDGSGLVDYDEGAGEASITSAGQAYIED